MWQHDPLHDGVTVAVGSVSRWHACALQSGNTRYRGYNLLRDISCFICCITTLSGLLTLLIPARLLSVVQRSLYRCSLVQGPIAVLFGTASDGWLWVIAYMVVGGSCWWSLL